MKGTDRITGSTDKERQKQTSQSHEENGPPPMVSTLEARGWCHMPLGLANISGSAEKVCQAAQVRVPRIRNKKADPGFYVTGGRVPMLLLSQFKCHHSGKSSGQVPNFGIPSSYFPLVTFITHMIICLCQIHFPSWI